MRSTSSGAFVSFLTAVARPQAASASESTAAAAVVRYAFTGALWRSGLMSAMGRKLPLAATRNFFPTGGHLCLRLADAASASSAHLRRAKGHTAEQVPRGASVPISAHRTRTL